MADSKSTDELPTYTVPMSEWLRGEGSWGSALLRLRDGKRCCLGHVGKQCGIPDECLQDRKSPISVPVANWPHKLLDDYGNSGTCQEMMHINDDRNTDDDYKITELMRLAPRAGFHLKFIP